MSAKLQKQIAALSNRLAQLEVRRRAPQQTPSAPQPARRRRRRRRAGTASLRAGELDAVVRVTRKDILMTVEGNKLMHAELHHNNLPGLHKFAGIYERITWHSAKVWWRPSLGTTEAGMVTYGVDWDLKNTDALTRAQIALYTPSASHAVWMDTSSKPLILPAARLSSRKIMFFSQEANSIDGSPACLVALSTHAKGGGEFWIEYTVTLSGVHP